MKIIVFLNEKMSIFLHQIKKGRQIPIEMISEMECFFFLHFYLPENEHKKKSGCFY